MEKTEALIMEAIAGGVNYFDTAYIYPGSEEAVGEILEKNEVRNKVFIASKLPLVYCRGPQDFDKFFARELDRLRTGHIDYYLMHMLTDMELWEKLVSWGIKEWIQKRLQSGEIRHIGFSFHGSEHQFMQLLEVYPWEFCYIQYNYSDENFQAGVRGLKKAREKGLTVFVMEPLMGGRLTAGLPKAAQEVFDADEFTLPGGNKRSLAAWGLRWVWDQGDVCTLLSGMNELEQLRENMALCEDATPQCLTDRERDAYRKVAAIFREANKIPCTGCAYCMPCPRNVNIPGVFSAYNMMHSLGFYQGMRQFATSAHVISAKPAGPSLCIKCGKCEKHCPQNLHIIEGLDEVKHRMEPALFRGVFAIARLVLGRKASA
jgi:predicted aldo/keto reductase-like oxidoreductase